MKQDNAEFALALARSAVLRRSPLRYVTRSFVANLRTSRFHSMVGSWGTNNT